jgi:hypothetical protein
MTQEQFNDLPNFIKEKLIASGARPDQVEVHRVRVNDEDEAKKRLPYALFDDDNIDACTEEDADKKKRLLHALFGADDENESENEDNIKEDTTADSDENSISPDTIAKVLIESGITDPKTIESITGMPIEKTVGMGADATADNYIVTVTYSVIGHYQVRAASVEDAIKTVADHADELPLLNHPVRMPGSVQVASDPAYTAAINATKVDHVTESHLVSDIAKRLDSKKAPADEQ